MYTFFGVVLIGPIHTLYTFYYYIFLVFYYYNHSGFLLHNSFLVGITMTHCKTVISLYVLSCINIIFK